MLAVSHTKPLHDAVAQMADDLYGGYAPATPFSINKRFIDSLKYDCLVKQPYFIKILIEKSVFFCNSLSLRNAIYGADGSTEMTAYAL